MAEGDRFVLNQETINPNLKEVQYAVRGPVLDRAMEIDRDLQQVTQYGSPKVAQAHAIVCVPIATTTAGWRSKCVPNSMPVW